MSLLVLLTIIVGLVLLGRIFRANWADAAKSRPFDWETWASQSWLRIFGAPFLAATAIFVLAHLIGAAEAVRHFFAYGFIGFMLFAVFLNGVGAGRVRLGVKMAFMTIFFGTILSLLLP